jgi:glycosyltransferase involved in cell wall biosynthesis
VVQTDDVNWRLRDWLKTENVYTVSNTHSQHYNCPKVVGNKLPEKAIDEFRFLTISAWHTHKNLKIIPKVIDALPQEIRNRVRFILTLPDETYQKNFSGELGDNIINVGPVKPEEGPALYQECDALFLPTLLECFSASYAEAMKMEKPIITSDLSFAHTICGEAALYAEPLNSNAFSEKIIALIESQQLQDQLIKAGANQLNEFVTAKERAERYLTICKELAYERAKTQ